MGTANTFDDAAKGIPKGEYTRNMFGAQAGAPLMKDKHAESRLNSHAEPCQLLVPA